MKDVKENNERLQKDLVSSGDLGKVSIKKGHVI